MVHTVCVRRAVYSGQRNKGVREMDPNACLAEIREIVADQDTPDDIAIDGLVERIHALDEWLSKGGFLPTEWQRLSRAETEYLARCVDLGRSDPQASAILRPTERDALLSKLGGRR